jgi:hypothetical protein
MDALIHSMVANGIQAAAIRKEILEKAANGEKRQ